MNKNYLLLAMVIIGAGILYKRSMEGMKESESPSADMVTLISNDGQKFQISREAAELSHTINAALSGPFEEATTKEFPLKYIDGTVLDRMVPLLEKLQVEKDKREDGFNLDNFVIELFARTDIRELPDLAIAASFLQIEQLADSLMRLYIFQSLKASPLLTANNIKNIVNKQELNRIIQKEYPIIMTSAGFKALGSVIDSFGILNLPGKGISNAYGLSLIDGKDTIKTLYLDWNQLRDLSAGLFNGLSSLQCLDLANNNLKDVPAEVFNLHAEVFNGLIKLKELRLSSNQLKDLPAGIFNGLSKLKYLYLDNNKLKDLPAGIFNGLTDLERLSLSYNQLDMTADQIKQRYFPPGSTVEVAVI